MKVLLGSPVSYVFCQHNKILWTNHTFHKHCIGFPFCHTRNNSSTLNDNIHLIYPDLYKYCIVQKMGCSRKHDPWVYYQRVEYMVYIFTWCNLGTTVSALVTFAIMLWPTKSSGTQITERSLVSTYMALNELPVVRHHNCIKNL